MATLKDLTTSLKLEFVDLEDVQATQRALIQVTPAGASLELPRGKKGEPGKDGAPGPQVWWTGLITDPSELPGDLTAVDRGCAWADTVSKSVWIWDGEDFFEIPDFIGLRGEPGETATVQVGEVVNGSEAKVTVNEAASTDTVTVLDFELPQGPRGIQGEKGESGDMGPLGSADDVDLSVAPNVGDSLVWDGAVWRPGSTLSPVGPWALGPNDFSVANVNLIQSGSWASQVVATMTVPALPFDWRPIVVGGLVELETPLGYRVDVEVRVGNAQQGDVIGYGRGKPLQRWEDPTVIQPSWAQTVTPSSAYGVVKANTATTIYVVLVKADGTIGAWKSGRENCGLTIMAQPTNGGF
ncbi:phage tail protein [Corynebacterium neomassiliense]|uniref:phage tail protein n=1 Tax=Corynebacterium neomassiliense TaxID=2079482 RepID=UPI0010300D31|nr:phage tail protein [Corynebacterium neomassiliense]